MLIKIIFYAPWATPSQYLDQLTIYTQTNQPYWEGKTFILRGVTDVLEADYYIILDDGRPEALPLDYRKKIFLKREPDCVKKLLIDPSNYFFVGTFDKIPLAATPWILKPYTFLKNLTYEKRNKKISVVCSGKTDTPAHRQRLECIKYLTSRLPPLTLDVYGQGLDPSQFNNCYRGSIPTKCKYDCLSQYTYSLAFENFSYINHISEKLYDCYLSLCIPIYWGCPNVTDYYPSNSLHVIDIYNPEESLRQINSILSTEVTEDTITSLLEAKNLTLDKYNIWPIIEKIVSPSEVV